MTVTFSNLWTRDASFNAEYYLNVHMPLVARLLGPEVLVAWHLWQLPTDCPFSHEAAVEWASLEARQAALTTTEGQHCRDDAAHCASKPALVMLRQEVGAGRA